MIPIFKNHYYRLGYKRVKKLLKNRQAREILAGRLSSVPVEQLLSAAKSLISNLIVIPKEVAENESEKNKLKLEIDRYYAEITRLEEGIEKERTDYETNLRQIFKKKKKALVEARDRKLSLLNERKKDPGAEDPDRQEKAKAEIRKKIDGIDDKIRKTEEEVYARRKRKEQGREKNFDYGYFSRVSGALSGYLGGALKRIQIDFPLIIMIAVLGILLAVDFLVGVNFIGKDIQEELNSTFVDSEIRRLKTELYTFSTMLFISALLLFEFARRYVFDAYKTPLVNTLKWSINAVMYITAFAGFLLFFASTRIMPQSIPQQAAFKNISVIMIWLAVVYVSSLLLGHIGKSKSRFRPAFTAVEIALLPLTMFFAAVLKVISAIESGFLKAGAYLMPPGGYSGARGRYLRSLRKKKSFLRSELENVSERKGSRLELEKKKIEEEYRAALTAMIYALPESRSVIRKKGETDRIFLLEKGVREKIRRLEKISGARGEFYEGIGEAVADNMETVLTEKSVLSSGLAIGGAVLAILVLVLLMI